VTKKKTSSVAPATANSSTSRDARVTALTVSLSELKEQQAGLRRAQVMANLGHVITKPDGSFESWSETLPQLIGVHSDQVVTSTRKWLDLIHPADRTLFRDTALAARAQAKRADVEYRLWRNDSTWIHVRQVEPIAGRADSQGRMRWFNTLQDITQQKRAEERIKRLNRVYAVLSGINSLIVRVRSRDELFKETCELAVKHGNFRMAWLGLVDRAAAQIMPVASAGDVGDFFRQARLSLVQGSPDFGLSGQALRELKPAISHDIQRDPHSVLKDEYGQRGINSLCVMPLIVGSDGVGVMGLYASEVGFFDEEEMRLLLELAGDVSFAMQYIEKSERAEYLALYDPLTGLANRTLFHEMLAQHVEDATKEHRKLALVIVDIERFKTINDTMGRQAGDALLTKVAERIMQSNPQLRTSRIGGDHFAVVVTDVTSEDELARWTENRIKDFFGTPYQVSDTELRISGKCGISMFPNDASDADQLYRNAEAALKKAKQAGEPYLFYEQRMTQFVSERLSLENKLHRAVEKQEFVLHYQPKVHVDSKKIVGLEALLRWNSPELGLVPPMRFIPLLEETGMILEVGRWALRRAILDQQLWASEGLQPPRIAVNVSAIQLRHRNFVELVRDATSATAGSSLIDLEITESRIMEDIDANIAKLKEIGAMGIGIAIDDFGTGYSSLAYLAKLPVQTLKIDRSFIVKMLEDDEAMAIVQTIISLAQSLKLSTVAEGVETEQQADVLELLRCDQMQGYYVSKPKPREDIGVFLAKL
jgi:diguanylate cyclase (GGDEF)-like protein/PAS domain S-box-containing protein